MRPKLLDLFCGEGGASMGYHLAGFDVEGVDTSAARLARYPFSAYEGDAIEFVLAHGHEYDAIAASPTCTGYSRGTAAIPDRLTRYDRLIAATREALRIVGKPYVIENVEDAKSELVNPITLCWTEFRQPGSVEDEDGTPLWMRRHRLFEVNWPVWAAGGCRHPVDMQCAGAYGGARRDKWEAKHVRKGGYVPSLPVMRELLGTPWMSEKGCQLSIPPAYTTFIGRQLLGALQIDGERLRDSSPSRTLDIDAFPGHRTSSPPRMGDLSDTPSFEHSLQSACGANAGCSPASNRGRDVPA